MVQTVNIDVTKLDKTLFFKGEKGTYLTLVLFDNKDGEDQYGNAGIVKQSTPKDDRERQMPILGNYKVYGEPVGGKSAPKSDIESKFDDGDDIPF